MTVCAGNLSGLFFGLFLLFGHCNADFVNTYVINDFAGNHVAGFTGDGGPAILAKTKAIRGVWVTTDNEVYLSDFGNGRIRVVDSNAIISTFAGNDNTAIDVLTENQQATSANLTPWGLFQDTLGFVYVASSAQATIRKVNSTSRVITSVAGTGVVSTDPTAANGDGGSPTSATFKAPSYLFVMTTGVVYISDTNNQKVRVISVANIITTFAGRGALSATGDKGPATSSNIRGAAGIWADAAGNVFIGENAGGARIRRVDAATNIITTFAGTGNAGSTGDGGAASSARLSAPVVLWGDSTNKLFIATDQQIRVIDLATNNIYTIGGDSTNAVGYAGNGMEVSTATKFKDPYQIHISQSGTIFVADSNNYVVRALALNTLPPTALPTAEPSASPSIEPTSVTPTIEPSSAVPTTAVPTAPTAEPTALPSAEPSGMPSNPTFLPTVAPSAEPSATPTFAPTAPTVEPTLVPSPKPTTIPSIEPSQTPSVTPTRVPTQPTIRPSISITPTEYPSTEPSYEATEEPSEEPTEAPTNPTFKPSIWPSVLPSPKPPTAKPSFKPSAEPTDSPTRPTQEPTIQPSPVPTADPSISPSAEPTTRSPTAPTVCPTTHSPTYQATRPPTPVPTVNFPTLIPTCVPTTSAPSVVPTLAPTRRFVEFGFYSSLHIRHARHDPLLIPDQNAIATAVAKVAKLSFNNVQFTEQKLIGPEPDGSNTFEFEVVVFTWAYTKDFDFMVKTNATQAYIYLRDLIHTAVFDGSFTEVLLTNTSIVTNATAFSSTWGSDVVAVTSTNYEVIIHYPPTYDDYLANEEVAGVGIVGVLGSLAIIALSLAVCSVMEEKGY